MAYYGNVSCPLAFIAAFLPSRLSPTPSPCRIFFKDTWEERLRENRNSHRVSGVTNTTASGPIIPKAARDERRTHLEKRLAEAVPHRHRQADAAGETERPVARLRSACAAGRLGRDRLCCCRLANCTGCTPAVYQAFDGAPARTVRDYENQLLRLRGIPKLIDQRLAVLDEAIAKRMTQPKVVVDRVMQQVADQIRQTPGDSALLEAFRHFPGEYPGRRQQRLKSQATEAYQSSFLPAWKKLYAYLETKYLPAARAEHRRHFSAAGAAKLIKR